MKPEIVLEIDEWGEHVTLEVCGERGQGCLAVTEFLEQGLGEVTSRTLKTDASWRKPAARNRLRSGRTRQGRSDDGAA